MEIEDVSGREIRLLHADNLAFHEGKSTRIPGVMMKVFVSRDREHAEPESTVLMDLLGPGARLKNPGNKFRIGDDHRSP